MVWVLPSYHNDLRTCSLTASAYVMAFGVHQGLVGGEAPLAHW